MGGPFGISNPTKVIGISNPDKMMGVSGLASAACTTPTIGSELNEGWVGAGAENTWATYGSGGSYDEDHSLSGTPPTGSCTEGLNVLASGANYARQWNRGSAIDTSETSFNFYMSIYIDSVSLDSYGYGRILTWSSSSDASTGNVFTVRLRNNAGTYQIQANSAVASTLITVTQDAWHEIFVHIDSTAASSYFQMDGGTQYSFTVTDTTDGQYLTIGATGDYGSGETLDIEFGYVYIDIP